MKSKLLVFLMIHLVLTVNSQVANKLNLNYERDFVAKLKAAALPKTNSLEVEASDSIILNNVFLKGKYIEVGVSECGCFGTTVNQPDGFHGNIGNRLGFVVDADKDGWTTGDPAFNGDYFLPGSPEEGFGVEINGVNYGNFGRCETYQIPVETVSRSYDGSTHEAIWKGTIDGLEINQKVFFLQRRNLFYYSSRFEEYFS